MKRLGSASIVLTSAATLALGLVQVGPFAAGVASAAKPPPPAATQAAAVQPAPPSPSATKRVSDPPDPKPLTRAAAVAAPAVPLPTGAWAPLGPAPIGPPFLQSGGFYGGANSGRVLGTTVLANGAHPGRVVIGTAGGGIWTSDNNGTTWTPRTDGLAIPSLAIGDVAAAPSNSNNLVAGTGEGAPCGDCYPGAGMLVSTNGGDTWTLSNPGNVFTGVETFQVAFDPTNPTHAFAATTAGLFVTTDLSTWALPSDPSYGNNVGGNVTSVVVDPTNPLNVYVGNVQTGVAKSGDGGVTWAAANSGISVPGAGILPMEKLDIAASSPSTLYLSIGSEIAVAVYKTTNGGVSWTSLPAPNFTGQAYAYGSGSGQQGWYDNIIKVDPANASHVVAGGIAVVESNDGGATWGNVNSQPFFGGGTNKFHPDQHALAFAGGKVWIGNDGGMALYNNPGNAATSSITDANGNLNITQFYFGFNEVSGQILAGAQDNGSARTTSASQVPWTGIIVGDGGPSAITPNDTAVQFSIGNQNLRVTTDAWASVSRVITPPISNALFTPPILIIPNTGTPSQPTTFYGGDRLYRTTNPTTIGPTWNAVATSPGFGLVSAIAYSPSNPMEVYVGFDDGNIMVSSDGGATFSALTTVPFGEHFVTGISVDPTNANAITVSVSFNDTRYQFGAPHVAQYSSGTWTVIDGNLPGNAAVSKVVYDNGALLAATDQGVYGTGLANGSSTTWTRIGTGLPYVQTQDLFVDPTTHAVYAVTHGRGAWVLAPPSGPLAVTSTVTVGKLPTGVVASATRAYVANSQSNTVSVIDTTASPPMVIGSIPTGAYPNGVALSADGSQLYVTDYLAASLTIIQTSTNTVQFTVPVGTRPDGVVFFNNFVYVANLLSGTVSQVDPNLGSVVGTIALPSGGAGAAAPSGVVATPASPGAPNGTLYVNDVRNGVTLQVTLPTTVAGSVAAGVHPAYISTLGSAAYVASPGDNSIKVLNVGTTPPTAVTSVAVGAAPYGVVADGPVNLVLATSSGANTVTAIDPTTNTVVGTPVAVGTTPDAVAVSPDGATAFVTNESDGTVSILHVT